MMDKIIIATKNKHKTEEFRMLFSGYDVVSLCDLGFEDEIKEDAETFEGNARIKASFIAGRYGAFAVADDSGLVVDSLGGAPGVYSARYAGENASDTENLNKLLYEMENIPDNERTARFVAVLCGVYPDGREIIARGECEGLIVRERCGAGNFGYDPVFYYPPLGKTFAELSGPEKNKISHRGIAVRKFINSFDIDKQ